MTSESRQSGEMLIIVNNEGEQLERPLIRDAFIPLLERYVAPLDQVMLPVVLKIPPSGGSWLYVYVDERRGLRAQVPASIVHLLSSGSAPKRIHETLESVVKDLSANLRSRRGAKRDHYRPATRSLRALKRKTDD